MIIVKTKNGANFINEKEVEEVQYNREKATVYRYDRNGNSSHQDGVESVLYYSDAQPVKWKAEGSEVMQLIDKLEKVTDEKDRILEHMNFIREWCRIFREALYTIRDSCEFAKRENKDVCVDQTVYIENAEKEYEKSLKRFCKVQESWNKEHEYAMQQAGNG